jgi:N-acyl-phosphatidylethanolamine-hydrolysing phospholipase D
MKQRFGHPWKHEEHRFLDVLKWKLRLGPREERCDAPDAPAGWMPWKPAVPPSQGWRVSWLGHASFLLEGCGLKLLVDPVFSPHCAPVPLPALRRWVQPPCGIGDIGPVDVVLLTHSHYDHLDLPTLRRIGGHVPLVVPPGHAAMLRRRGFSEVRELSWFERTVLHDRVTVTATPAQHFTARTPWDRNRGHWCGWRIDGDGVALWHAGDSGYAPVFREIGEKLGVVDFGMIPIGAYAPRWLMKPMHMTPEEAVTVFHETRCRRAVGMHWGTFRLTDEPMGEPALRLSRMNQDGFFTGKVGESWLVLPGNDGE